MTRFAKVLATVLAAGAVSVVAPAAAQAAEYGCAGNLIDTYSVKSETGNVTLSTIRLYYNAGTGRNCAVNLKAAAYQGSRSQVDISIYTSDFREDDNNKPGINNDFDSGNFSEYAGPVSVVGKGKCISMFARTWAGGKRGFKQVSAVHCG
ncbi:hypothetical protein BBK82_23745 [Lentzea guizhouensis]|uniref:Spore-associated protein A n=1 Tax=Lentzea guizhouensis TaxID=1586287 RepID=A0A1B2HLL8_9PSEU|nr:hypothetical protein [Lentzea guizhouensis]ANZ38624.1 hypothetical protein BBK82_23745 [Lentzea guizhouensis]